jgi:hypothetical protein
MTKLCTSCGLTYSVITPLANKTEEKYCPFCSSEDLVETGHQQLIQGAVTNTLDRQYLNCWVQAVQRLKNRSQKNRTLI